MSFRRIERTQNSDNLRVPQFPPSLVAPGGLSHSARRVHQAINAIFQLEKKTILPWDGTGAAAIDVGADISTAVRGGIELGEATDAANGLVAQSFNDPIGGLSTAGNIVTGAYTIYKARDRVTHSGGVLEARAEYLKGVVQIAAGGVFGAYRPMSMALVIKGADAPSLLGRVTYILGIAGGVLFGILFILVAFGSAVRYFKLRSLEGDLKRLETPSAKLGELKKRLLVNRSRVHSDLRKSVGERLGERATDQQIEIAIQEELISKALEMGARGLKELTEKLGDVRGKKVKDNKEAVLKLFDLAYEDLPEDEKKAAVNERLAEIGMAFSIAETSLKEESRLAELVGREVVEKLKGDLRSNDPDHVKMIAQFEQVLNEKRKINGATFWFCVIGVAATAATTLFTGGAIVIAASTILLVLALLVLAMDGVALHQELSRGEVLGKYDAPVLKFHTILWMISIIVAVVCTAVYGLPLLPLIFLGIIGGGWLGVNLLALRKMESNRLAAESKKPTVHTYKRVLERKKRFDLEAMRLYRRLPEVERRRVHSIYIANRNHDSLKGKTRKEKMLWALQEAFKEQKAADNQRFKELKKSINYIF